VARADRTTPLVGDLVQTPFGKGTLLELRNRQVVVAVGGRTLVLDSTTVKVASGKERRDTVAHESPTPTAPATTSGPLVVSLDLHGLTVDEALARVDAALNEALLGGALEMRVIHGRSGGRIRAALQVHLRRIGTVRHFRLDPRNPGVTVITL
jgi:DNA mismatch repair protein MutS2